MAQQDFQPRTLADAGAVSRKTAAGIVSRWLRTGEFPDRMLSDRTPDRAFVQDLVFGTVRHRRSLDWALARYLRRPPASELQGLLLVGAQQILFMPAIADYAALHATVEASKALPSRQPGFVNAILRNLVRDRDSLLAALAREPLALRTSHPDDLVRRWEAALGKEEAERICLLDNEPAETVATVLPFGRPDAASALLARWAEAGVSARPHPLEPASLVLGRGTRVESLPGFAEGLFVVQDAATLAALRLLRPELGQVVLDACAAPGGKTLQIAAAIGPRGKVYACDLHADRLGRLRENIARAAIGGRVEVREADASSPALARELADQGIQLALVDAPCSNTGVLRRRPDARWRFSENRLAKLREVQLAILSNVAVLRPERLVYSTCSLEPEEDEQVIEAFLATHPDYRLGESIKLLPDDSPRDGAFAATLVR